MSSSASAKRSATEIAEEIASQARGRTSPATTQKAAVSDEAFADISSNPIYQIMFDPNMSMEEKKSAVAKHQTFSGTKEEMRERNKALDTFSEYLQHVREKMSTDVIRLTDTEAFSELKNVYDELNTKLIDFNEKMSPLTDIIDALYKLRSSGKTLDAFKQIKNDQIFEEETKAKIEEKKAFQETIERDTRAAERRIAELSEQKSFFGLGGIKEAARVQIAQTNLQIETNRTLLDSVKKEVADLEAKLSGSGGEDDEFAEERKQLRELLNISSDAHKERQEKLVAAALDFVSSAKERIGSVRSHLGKMDEQIEGLGDTNSQMGRVYAVLGEGLSEAEQENAKIRQALEAPEGSESMIEKATREEKKGAVERHIGSLMNSTKDILVTAADLETQRVRIKNMRDANESQVSKARTMHSQGVAGVADRLSTVLQAVSAAALGESSAMAKDTLAQMLSDTNQVSQKESIRIAMGITETNEDLMKAIDDLGAYGATVRASTEITTAGLQEMRANLEALKNLAEGVHGDVNQAIAVHADTGKGGETKAAAAEAKPAPAAQSPFKFGA